MSKNIVTKPSEFKTVDLHFTALCKVGKLTKFPINSLKNTLYEIDIRKPEASTWGDGNLTNYKTIVFRNIKNATAWKGIEKFLYDVIHNTLLSESPNIKI